MTKSTLDRLFEAWDFVPDEELPGGHCSHVYADATRVVKVPWQGEEMSSGYHAAWLLANCGGPKVLAGDQETGTVLMERITPGTSLASVEISDHDAFGVAEGFVRRMEGLPISNCLSLHDAYSRREPLVDWMLATSREPVFLHGDLHHENVLLGRDGWVMIDPKGLAGDRAFEAAAFMRNPLALGHRPDLEQVLSERLSWWALALDSEPWRIWGWTLATLREDPLDAESSWGKVAQALEQMWPAEVPRL